MTNNERIFNFLRELSVNNDRAWFKERKNEYDEMHAVWLNDMERLIHLMAEYDESLKGLTVNASVYRIYRDIRFSNDKSPYKTYFSAVVGQGGRKTNRAAYYLHMQPGNCGLHAGIWWPEASILSRLRHSVEDNLDEFVGIIEDKRLCKQFKFYGDTLKMLPKGFAKDTPRPELIKMKEYLCQKAVSDDYFFDDKWAEKVAADFKTVKPFNDFLNYIFDEDNDA